MAYKPENTQHIILKPAMKILKAIVVSILYYNFYEDYPSTGVLDFSSNVTVLD